MKQGLVIKTNSSEVIEMLVHLYHLSQINFDCTSQFATGNSLSSEYCDWHQTNDKSQEPAGIKAPPYEAILITLLNHGGIRTPGSPEWQHRIKIILSPSAH